MIFFKVVLAFTKPEGLPAAGHQKELRLSINFHNFRTQKLQLPSLYNVVYGREKFRGEIAFELIYKTVMTMFTELTICTFPFAIYMFMGLNVYKSLFSTSTYSIMLNAVLVIFHYN